MTSRQAVCTAELNRLIAVAMAERRACEACRSGPVVPATAGASGCNWRISLIEGHGCLECLAALQARIAELQQRYVLDPAGASVTVAAASTVVRNGT